YLIKIKKKNALSWAMKMSFKITGNNWKRLNKKHKENLIELGLNVDDQIMFEEDRKKIWAMEMSSKIIGKDWLYLCRREQISVIVVANNPKDRDLFE
ncbi:MAG: hypothetical protein KKF52_04780, partial [Nanoarchaeota archaeon]|nr:hypothetical protein [Nanoarchaeota archaeon]